MFIVFLIVVLMNLEIEGEQFGLETAALEGLEIDGATTENVSEKLWSRFIFSSRLISVLSSNSRHVTTFRNEKRMSSN